MAVGQKEENDHDEEVVSLEQQSLAATATAEAAAAASGENCGNERHSVQDPWSTRRHSSQMADLWRTQMPEQDAAAIWEACLDSGVMEELKYSF